MTKARTHVFDTQNTAAYHYYAHCVRGAWLCGSGHNSSRPLEQRQDWIEARVLDLCESFSVGMFAWAIMDNHLHLVIVVDPQMPQTWTDLDVAHRWCRITQIPGATKDPKKLERDVANLAMNPAGLEEKRQWLGSLSWFMRHLNEGIARRANREDGNRGHFWEGRYGCRKLLDDNAMIAGMVYVDLNPIRAGMVDTLGDSQYTTIHRRLRSLANGATRDDAQLWPIAGPVTGYGPDLSNRQYINMVDCMGRQPRPGKGAIDANAPPALAGANGRPAGWQELYANFQNGFGSAVGSEAALTAHARSQGQCWIRGIGLARQIDQLDQLDQLDEQSD